MATVHLYRVVIKQINNLELSPVSELIRRLRVMNDLTASDRDLSAVVHTADHTLLQSC